MDIKSIAQLYQIAFTHGRSWQVGDSIFNFSVARAGVLRLPSGRIVACDPLVSSDKKQSFIQGVRPGKYPVDLALVSRDEDKEERIALARISFTRNAPVVWVKAVVESEQEAGQGVEGHGYAAGTGTGSFMDAETVDLFQLASINAIDQILDQLMANYRPIRNWLEHPVDERHNVILFTSGYTPASSPSYFAIDAGGDICLLVTACWTERI